jgi:hypothetical protein
MQPENNTGSARMGNVVQAIAHVFGASSVSVDGYAYWAQAIGTVAAVFASIALYVAQRCREQSRDKQRRESVRAAIIQIATQGRALAYETYDPMEVFEKVGTWPQYAAFRKRQFAEFRDCVAALPTQDIAEIDLLDVAMKLRVNLRDMSEVIGESNFHSGEGWISSRRMITLCKANFDEIAKELGIDKGAS